MEYSAEHRVQICGMITIPDIALPDLKFGEL